MPSLKLTLTRAADQDLDDLYTEGLTTWGANQADRYFDGLLTRFERICEAPQMYTPVDDIRPGYRRSVYERHAIYFVVKGDAVEIHAIVKRQDISRRL